MKCSNLIFVISFVVLISCVLFTFSQPISVVDRSPQNLARLKNSSYVYMVYNGSSSCHPHCRMPVSYPAIPLYGDDTYLLHTTRPLIDVLNDITAGIIKDKMLVCAMPTYLISKEIKTSRALNCTTVKDLSEIVLPKDLVTFGKPSKDDKDYVDPFNPPELDVNDAFNEYNNNYDENNQQNNRDYSNNYDDGNNDNVDYSSDYNGAPAETDNFPDYGPQQTIEANTRVEQNNNKQDTSSTEPQCPGGGLHECIDVCPSSNLIAFKVCVNVCVRRCP